MGMNVTRRQLEYEWNGAYWYPTLFGRILGPFRCFAVTVGNNGRGLHNVILDAGNDDATVRGVMADGWSGWLCLHWECLLGGGS